VFDVKGFKPRMDEIRARVRPKLDAFGGKPRAPRSAARSPAMFSRHVAKARAAYREPRRRHLGRVRPRPARLQEALSLQGGPLSAELRALPVRGRPEHSDKRRWARSGGRMRRTSRPVLRRVKHLAWFKNEQRRRAGGAPRRPHARDDGRVRGRADATRDGQLVRWGAPCRPRRPRAGRRRSTAPPRSRLSARWRPSIVLR